MRSPRPTILARLRRCAKGASAVEFALVAPIFLMMVLGMMEIGRALWIKNTMQYAVEEAARYAIINTDATTAQVTSYAAGKVPGTWNVDSSNFSTSTSTSGGVKYYTITGSYDFVPMVTIIKMNPFTLEARARVPVRDPT